MVKMETEEIKLSSSTKPTDLEIPSILESISQEEIDNFKPFHERYFVKKYCTNFSTAAENLDTCIRVHTNKICLVYLSERHSIVAKKQRIQQIDFNASKKINRLQNKMSGKGKRGAQNLQPDSIICKLVTTDGVTYPVHAGITGKLLEINQRLLNDPNCIVDDLNEGFIAIILPDLSKHEVNLKLLKTPEDYNT